MPGRLDVLSKLRSRLSTAHLIALVALFFAIGGPSFAANAVSSAARLITGKQIKDSSLTTKDIKNGSLLKADFRAGQLPVGAPGPKGDTGPSGHGGNDGTSVTSASENAGANCANGGSKFTAASGVTYACNGEPGAARGYAHIMSDGSIDAAHSKNAEVAGKGPTGFYCVRFTFTASASTPPDNLVATLDSQAGEIRATGIHCIGNDMSDLNAQVRTYDSAGTPADRDFFIMAN
jgi:hypothetical protein